jgi:hypothetical protein
MSAGASPDGFGCTGGRRVSDRFADSDNMCMHCGAVARPLGRCTVCGFSVCAKCGNVQHSHGERRPTHDSCLKDDDDGFSMIRFVK